MANVDDLGKDWKRRDKSRHTYDFEELPYQLDTQMLSNEAPTVDRERGMGRVVQTLMEATQGNFDHLQGQLRKNRDVNNEHAADTSYIKRELLPHEHDQDFGLFPHREGEGRIYLPWSMALQDYIAAADGPWACPIFISDATPVDGIAVHIGTTGTKTINVAIYDSAEDGGLPGNFLTSGSMAGDVGVDLQICDVTEVELPGGVWYWLAYGANGAGTTPSVGSLQCDFFDAHFNLWPFGSMTSSGFAYDLLSTIETVGISNLNWSTGAGWAASWNSGGDPDDEWNPEAEVPLLGIRVP